MALSYTSSSNMKTALGITDTTDDALLAGYADEANVFVESQIGYPVGPVTSETRFFDGTDVSPDGRRVYVKEGVRTVTAMSARTATGEAYAAIPSSDFYLRPLGHRRETGWPATEIRLTDVTTSGNAFGSSLPTEGFEVLQVTGTWGFDAIPDDLEELATRLALSAWRNRSYGAGEAFSVGEDGARVFERDMSGRDWTILRHYRGVRHSGV